MNSLKNILAFLITLFSLGSFAQQGKILMPLETDSLQLEIEKQIEFRQLVSGEFSHNLLHETIKLPGFDLQAEFAKMHSLSPDLHNFNNMYNPFITSGMFTPFYSPFYQNGMILSEGAYKFNEKIIFGGFSYGANSMMSGPPVPGINKFDRYGSTLFMQYKVSKNIKIETRFNISQGGRYPGF